MTITNSRISSQYGNFNINDNDVSPVGTITVTGPDGFSTSIEYINEAEQKAAAFMSAVNSVNTKISDISKSRLINEFAIHNSIHSDLRNIHSDLRNIHFDLRNIHSDLRNIHSELRDDVRVLRIRGENENLGIYQNHVCEVCDDDRAILVTALKDSGVFDQVIAESRNPSPPPDFL